jgi:hypothetical protein
MLLFGVLLRCGSTEAASGGTWVMCLSKRVENGMMPGSGSDAVPSMLSLGLLSLRVGFCAADSAPQTKRRGLRSDSWRGWSIGLSKLS